MARLYAYARRAKPPVVTPTDLAKALNESPQTVKNWEYRGISKKGALASQAHFGVSATWLLEGVGDDAAPHHVMEQRPPRYIPLPELPPDETELLMNYRRVSPTTRHAVLTLLHAVR